MRTFYRLCVIVSASVFIPPLSAQTIQQPYAKDQTILVTPAPLVAPATSASLDVFSQCAAPLGPSLLQPGTLRVAFGVLPVALKLAAPLVGGNTVCVTETFDGGPGAPGTTVKTGGIAVLNGRPAAPPILTGVTIKGASATQTFILVDAIPPVPGQTAKLDVFAAACPAGAPPAGSSLLMPGQQTNVDSSGASVTLALAKALATGDALCAQETFAGVAKAAVNSAVLKVTAAAPAPALIPPPTVPFVPQQLREGMSTFQIKAQKVGDNTYPGPANIQVCIFEPAPVADGDCTKTGGVGILQNLTNTNDSKKKGTQIAADESGNLTVTLGKPLSLGQEVYVVETTMDFSNTTQKTISLESDVLVSNQCNKDFKHTPFSDCDWNFSIIGGLEQAGSASEPNATNGYLRAFTRAGLSDKLLAWASVRVLSAPDQKSSAGVVSAFSDPTGATVVQQVSSVGTAIDYFVGFESSPWSMQKHAYTVGLIAGFGGTTPLFSTTVTEAFKAPAYGTTECLEFQNRFLKNPMNSYLATHNIFAGSGTDATPASGTKGTASCLVNYNSVTTTGTSTTTSTFAPIDTIGFSNQDRAAFLGKWYFGLRTIDRFRPKGIAACGDSDPVNRVGPCARGVVDFLFGADASINRGLLRPWVFKVEAVHPLLIKDTSYLYIFGSFSIRMAGNINYAPLILQSSDPAALNNGGQTPVPNVNTVVLPLNVPARDFYRFGVGVDISCIFTKLFSSSSACSGFPTTPVAPK